MPPRSFYLTLPASTRAALNTLAAEQLRTPRDQARVLIECGLQLSGLLEPAPHREQIQRIANLGTEIVAAEAAKTVQLLADDEEAAHGEA